MWNNLTNIISWDSIWNPYTFPEARRIVMTLILLIVGSVCLTAIFFNIKKAIVVLKGELLFFWLFTIISATLLARKETADARINLELFWTVKYALEHRSGMHWFYIIGNIALFIPLGVLLPINGKVFRSCLLTVVIGLLLSGSIEAIQYFWKIGLCELDDIFNNTWGTLLGYCIYRLAAPVGNVLPKSKKLHCIVCKGGCAIMILGTVFTFGTLLRLNPPL